jgi:hypothetical protein
MPGRAGSLSRWPIRMTLYADDVDVAERALACYDLSPDSTLRLLNLSENATYAVEDAPSAAVDPARAPQELHRPRDRVRTRLARCAAARRRRHRPPCCPLAMVDASSPSPTMERTATSALRDGGGRRTRRGDADRRGLPHVGPITAVARPPRAVPSAGRFAWDWEHSLVIWPGVGGRTGRTGEPIARPRQGPLRAGL